MQLQGYQICMNSRALFNTTLSAGLVGPSTGTPSGTAALLQIYQSTKTAGSAPGTSRGPAVQLQCYQIFRDNMTTPGPPVQHQSYHICRGIRASSKDSSITNSTTTSLPDVQGQHGQLRGLLQDKEHRFYANRFVGTTGLASPVPSTQLP